MEKTECKSCLIRDTCLDSSITNNTEPRFAPCRFCKFKVGQCKSCELTINNKTIRCSKQVCYFQIKEGCD